MNNSELICHCQPPSELTVEQLDRLATFIENHGGVPPEWIRHNLNRAFLIAWAERGGDLVGSSCLKHPRPEYLKKLSERMGIALEGFLERGYTCVHPQQAGKGIASRLVDLLTEKAADRPFYALVHEDNAAIQAILGRSRQKKIKTFYSDLAGKNLGLWVSLEGAQRLGLD